MFVRDIEDTMLSGFSQARCWVWKTGTVWWLMPTKYSTICVADNTWWPYSIMNCSIQFGSWSHSGDEINLIPLDTNMVCACAITSFSSFLSFFYFYHRDQYVVNTFRPSTKRSRRYMYLQPSSRYL